jgi:hypothetical protein
LTLRRNGGAVRQQPLPFPLIIFRSLGTYFAADSSSIIAAA